MPSPHEQKQACTCSHETPGPRLWAQRPAAARRLKPALGALLREYAVGEKEKKKNHQLCASFWSCFIPQSAPTPVR